MAITKVSALTAKTSPSGSEELLINDGGTSKKITQTNLLSTALPKAGGTMTGTIAGFTSTGIDDNATSTAITIDASENVGVGVGVVPEAWDSQYKAIQLGAGGAIVGSTDGDSLIVSANMYEVGGVQKYINSSKLASQHLQNNGTHVFKVAASGTADAAISWTTPLTIANAGDVTVGTGNLVIGTSGKGIDFSADGNAADMTSEVLDDYETGDFTITLSSGATTTPTYTGCRYTKIGNIVHVDVYIGFAGITQNATAIQVTGLPFAPVNRILVPANCYQRVNFDSAKNQFWYIEAASTTLNLQEATTNTNSVSTVPSQSGSFSPVFDAISFSYHTA